MTQERQGPHSYAGPVRAGREEGSRGYKVGLVAGEEAYRMEEARRFEVGLVVEEEGHRVFE